MSSHLIFAGALAVLVLIMAVLWVRALRQGEIGIDLNNTSSPNDLFNITVRRNRFPILYWIVMVVVTMLILGFAVGVVLVAGGAA